MWRSAIACALVVLGASAIEAVPLQFGNMEMEGLAWENGGTRISAVGDTLNMVGVVTYIEDFWGVDLSANELTFRLTDLVVTSETVQPGWRFVTYSQGRIEMWLDPGRDHDYGVDPPNATAPATFTNGALFLGGIVHSFGITYYTGNPMGSLWGNATFTAGSAIDLAQQWASFGWPMLSGTVHPAGATEPQGYDLRYTGYLYAVIDAVEKSTWGGVKALYRAR